MTLRRRPLSTEGLMKDWKRQIEERLATSKQTLRRLAAAGYLCAERPRRGLIEVEKLTFVVLHDETLWDQFIGIRVAGFKALRVPWGISWGGRRGTSFERDLALLPEVGADGRRIDPLAGRSVLKLALKLDRKLDQQVGNSATERERLRLPPLWAAFRLADAGSIAGDGPEFDGACHRHGQSADELFSDVRHEHFGLVLYPLDWVSHLWEQFVAVYADLRSFPRTQVIALQDPQADLTGYRGAGQFDFWNSRFRRRAKSRHHQNGHAHDPIGSPIKSVLSNS